MDYALSPRAITQKKATLENPAKRRSVVHVVLSLAPGGLERLVCDLSAASIVHGMAMTICCLDDEGELAALARRTGIRVKVIKRRPGLDLGLFHRLATFFRAESADVVHTHGPDPMFYGGWAARLAGVPVRLHTQHDIMLGSARWRERLKFRLAIPAFHVVVGVSDKVREVVAPYGRRGRLLTIRNGIDEQRFVPAEVSHAKRREAGACVIGTVARLSAEKGLDRLIDAFAGLVRDHRSCRLIIAGSGPEASALAGQVDRLGLTKHVSFLGYTDRIEVVLRELDVFVLPSLTEGIPLALLEAMAAGLPVVATAVGGVPEVVEDGTSGRLVPPGDREALREALDRLVRDPGDRVRLARLARERIRDHFSLAAMAASYRELYRHDLAERRWLAPAKRFVRAVSPKRLMLWCGPSHRAEAALTLDDGPDPVYTPQLLDILSSYGVRATFFLVGERVAQHPHVVNRIVEDGHEIGSHSYSHPDFGALRWSQALEEIDATRRVLSRWTASSAKRLFRPPHGRICMASTAAAWLRGETVVLWNVDYKDYLAEEPSDITGRLSRKRPKGGDIVLFHGHNPSAVAALPAILESALCDGVSFVGVSRMLEAR